MVDIRVLLSAEVAGKCTAESYQDALLHVLGPQRTLKPRHNDCFPSLPTAVRIERMSIQNTNPDNSPTTGEFISATRAWLEKAVIGLNLCPFAKAVHVKNQIRYIVSTAQDTDTLHADLMAELQLLDEADSDQVDTILLIHPYVLTDFLDYNDFLDIADATLMHMGLAGKIQIASFHPGYQFADTAPDDIGNYTNRSPYPMLHLLREASVERAVAAFPDASEIFDKNIETMRALGQDGWRRLGTESGKKRKKN